MYRKLKKPELMKSLLIASVLVFVSACSDSDDDDDGMDGGGGGQIGTTDSGTGTGGDDTGGTTGETDGGTDDGDDDAVQEMINTDGTSTFTVPLSAEQEIPMLDLPGAEGKAVLIIDKASGAISGSLTYSGLSGTPSAAHIHQGFAGNNGGPIVFFDAAADGGSFDIPEGASLEADALTQLGEGALYINVHTGANAGGEIRGQIIPEDVLLEDTELSGDEMVPAVVTDASGFGYSTLNTETGALTAVIFTSGVTGASTAQIGMAAAGESGTGFISLVQDQDDPNTWRTPAGSTLTEEQIEAFEAENIFVIVSTDTYPGGEIRGQL